MCNKYLIWRIVITICLFSFDKNTGRRLLCPDIKGTIEDPIPGGFNKGEILVNGAGQFLQHADLSKESVVNAKN